MTTDRFDLSLAREQVRKMSIADASSHRFTERQFILRVVDILILNTAFLWALIHRPDLSIDIHILQRKPQWFITLTIIWFACSFLFDSYSVKHSLNFSRSARSVALCVCLTSLIYLLVPYLTPVLPVKRMQVFTFPLIAIFALVIWRASFAAAVVRLKPFRQNIIIIGTGEGARMLLQAIDDLEHAIDGKKQHSDYNVLGFIDDDGGEKQRKIDNVPVLGGRDKLIKLIKEQEVDEIVLAIPNLDSIQYELFDAILQCRELGVSITTMPRLYEQLTGRVPIGQSGHDLYAMLPVGRSGAHRLYLLAQRLVDIAGGIIGCLFVLMLIPLIWLANAWKSPGPLFYSQTRVGKGGKTFSIHKFRSMVVDAEKFTGAVWAAENDPRITPPGRFLRKTRLDEMPQFWNVVKGEMSLTGPRPERPTFTATLTEHASIYRARHAVKPGVTGWGQIKCRYGSSIEDQFFRLQHDLYYIKNQNLLLDVEILFKTVPIMVGLKGR